MQRSPRRQLPSSEMADASRKDQVSAVSRLRALILHEGPQFTLAKYAEFVASVEDVSPEDMDAFNKKAPTFAAGTSEASTWSWSYEELAHVLALLVKVREVAPTPFPALSLMCFRIRNPTTSRKGVRRRQGAWETHWILSKRNWLRHSFCARRRGCPATGKRGDTTGLARVSKLGERLVSFSFALCHESELRITMG